MTQRYIPVVHRALAAPVLALSAFMVVGPLGGAAFADAPDAPAKTALHGHDHGVTVDRLTVTEPDTGDTVSRRPVFAGFGRNGDTVTVWPKSGDAICSDVVIHGEWSCTPSRDLPDGNQVVLVNETEPDSEASQGLVRLRLFVDPDAPCPDEDKKGDHHKPQDRPAFLDQADSDDD